MTINPDDWCMDFGDDGTYPFVEDENANITGLGHQDPDEFAETINRYDVEVGGVATEEADWLGSIVDHKWAILDDDGERLVTRFPDGERVTEHHVGAIAITTLWGVR